MLCWSKTLFALVIAFFAFAGSINVRHAVCARSAKDRAGSQEMIGRPATIIVFSRASAGKSAANAANGEYGRKIVLAPPASATSDTLSPAVADLKYYLGKMTGVDYKIGASPSASAIILELAASQIAPRYEAERLKGKGIDPFLIFGDNSQLEIIANDERGLVNGIYFYLESLGVRWLLPNENWTRRSRAKQCRALN